jgi:hypothetical protein
MLLGVRFVLLALPVLVAAALAVALLTLGAGGAALAQEGSDAGPQAVLPAKKDHQVVVPAQNRG